MDVPYPGLPEVQAAALSEYPVTTTTLENGVRVVSSDSIQPIASVGAFLDTGSRFENPGTIGISGFLEFIAFKSTKDRSSFRLVREMLKLGVNVVCSTSREHTVYAADGLSAFTPQMVHTLADVIQNPIFEQQELTAAYAEYTALCEERNAAADAQVMEAIHAAAYHNNTVGLPLNNSANVPYFDADVLSEHVRSMFTADRLVLGGVGVEHSDFVGLVEQEFGHMAKSTPVPTEKAVYTGGDVRLQQANDPMAHVAIAFETASWHDPDLVPMCVLQMMMGGGGSFSAGGPGKGMYSRLYRNVLNRHHWVESANSFNSIFNDSAIFGIHGVSGARDAGKLVDVMCNEFVNMAGKVDDVEMSRAKTQLASSVHMQLETRSLQLEDISRQLVTYGKISTPKELCDKINAVSVTDIQRVASKMMKTPVSVATYGNTSFTPRYDDISRRFG
jgi:processing peptidase subunit alpha